MVTVFYGNQILGEFENWDDLQDVPMGCYAYDHTTKEWWNNVYYAWGHADDSIVPAICKAWLLIL